MSREPNLFLIGAPKTGTTAMAQYLSEHPQVFMSNPKELHFFNTDHRYRGIETAKDYARVFEAADDQHRIVAEASVWYLYSEAAVKNIEAAYQNARYLIMLRNPVEMAQSLHEQQVFSGLENETDFQTAWYLQDKRRIGKCLPAIKREPKHLLYKDACSLGTQLARTLHVVPKERIHLIFNDDFRTNPKEEWTKLLAFLGVQDDRRSDFPPINSAKARKSQFVGNIIAAIGATRQQFGIPAMKTGILTKIDRANATERLRAPIDPAFRQELWQEFENEIRLLSKITDRDLSHWK